MKTCSVCLKSKNEEDYFYRNKRTEKLHAQCKQCYIEKRRAIWKSYYHKHGSKYRENAVQRNKLLKIRLREQLVIFLSSKSCISCGNSDIRVLEFDHIDPKTKSFSIARAIGDIRSWDEIQKELKKCQVLCANCHKIKTAEEQGWYKIKFFKESQI